MKQTAILIPEFVESFPAEFMDGTLYVSMIYGTAAHKCCCGCGQKVITPFGKNDWKMTFDGDSISLHPSIGNWSFPCRSHYWIRENRVQWASQWSQEEINAEKIRDRLAKEKTAPTTSAEAVKPKKSGDGATKPNLWWKIKNWLCRKQ